MNNKTHAFSAGLLAIAIASCVSSASGQQTPARVARPQVPELSPGRQAPLCDVILPIKSTDPDEQGHLKVGQWLRFLGPIPNQGHMLVMPMDRPDRPPHAWRPGTHVAYRTTPVQDPPPWKFFLSVPVLSPPDHPSVNEHHYIMTVNELEGGCPKNIDIDTLPEDDEIVDDHPGHANA